MMAVPSATQEAHDEGPRAFGLRFSNRDAAGCAALMLAPRPAGARGAALFVTPNIQHIALAHDDAGLAEAMTGAELVVADGFPVARAARRRGVPLPGRVTGREVVERMFADPAALIGHRAYFVVDHADTAAGIESWAATRIPGLPVRTFVPPFGFDRDAGQCLALAQDIGAFDATLLFLCIGAPKSELFAHRYRALLPPCWALCVGQSFRLLLGTTTPPPRLLVALNLEWLWRIALEPRRMLRRYGPSTVGFLRAVRADRRREAKP